MSDTGKIHIELTGKSADAWNRIFDTLTNTIATVVQNLANHGADPAAMKIAHDITGPLAEIAKGWLKAKVERRQIENQKTLADIAAKFEELKLTRAKSEQVQVETEHRRLELWDKRLTLAFKWLSFLQTHFVRDDAGIVTLIMTNQNLSELTHEIHEIKRLSAPETVDD